MMEFVMSRVWMVIAGLAVTAAVTAAFVGLDQDIEDRVDVEGAKALAEMIDDLEREYGSADMRIDLDRVITDQGTSLVIRPGSIWVQGEGRGHAVTCPSNLILLENGERVDRLNVTRGDTLIVRASSGEVQLEKVSTM